MADAQLVAVEHLDQTENICALNGKVLVNDLGGGIRCNNGASPLSVAQFVELKERLKVTAQQRELLRG